MFPADLSHPAADVCCRHQRGESFSQVMLRYADCAELPDRRGTKTEETDR